MSPAWFGFLSQGQKVWLEKRQDEDGIPAVTETSADGVVIARWYFPEILEAKQ